MSENDEFIAAAQKYVGVEVTTPIESTADDSKVSQSDTKEDFKLNFKRIAEQDKMNRDARKTLEDSRKLLDKDKDELERYRAFDRQLKDDPLTVLEKLGLPYDRIQQLATQRNQNLDPKVLEARLKEEIKKEFNQRDEEIKKERYSLEELKLQSRISETVKQHEFDLIETFGAESAVREFMEEVYNESGQIPDIKTACEAVMEDLVEKASRVSTSKWLKKTEEKVIKELIQEEKKTKTLSNKMTQSSTPKVTKFMSEEERMQAAMALL